MPSTPRHPSEELTSEFLGDCSGCHGGVVARDGMAMSSLRIGEPALTKRAAVQFSGLIVKP